VGGGGISRVSRGEYEVAARYLAAASKVTARYLAAMSQMSICVCPKAGGHGEGKRGDRQRTTRYLAASSRMTARYLVVTWGAVCFLFAARHHNARGGRGGREGQKHDKYRGERSATSIKLVAPGHACGDGGGWLSGPGMTATYLAVMTSTTVRYLAATSNMTVRYLAVILPAAIYPAVMPNMPAR